MYGEYVSKPRISLRAIVDTAAHATTIVTAIQNRIAGKPTFDNPNIYSGVNELGEKEISFNFRLINSADRDD